MDSQIQLFAQVECNEACQQIISQRMDDGLADRAPLYSDVQGFSLKALAEMPDGLALGFPCQAGHVCSRASVRQGVSRAGRQRGMSDPRTGLVRELWNKWDENPAMRLVLIVLSSDSASGPSRSWRM